MIQQQLQSKQDDLPDQIQAALGFMEQIIDDIDNNRPLSPEQSLALGFVARIAWTDDLVEPSKEKQL